MIKRNLKPLPTSTATNAYELLDEIIGLVKEEPRRLNMNTWISYFDKFDVDNDRHLPECGTVACIAGWAELLRPVDTNPAVYGIEEKAEEILGLSREQSDHLFYFFPDYSIDGKNRLHPGDAAYVDMVVQHVREFMADNEAQLKEKVYADRTP